MIQKKITNTKSTYYQLGGVGVRVYRPDQGEGVDASNIIAKHCKRSAKYDVSFMDYNSTFNKYVSSLIKEKDRINSNTGQLKVLAFDGYSGVRKRLSKITEIAQMSPSNIHSMRKDEEYLAHLKEVCLMLHGEGEWQDSDAVIVPLRGGALVANLLPINRSKLIPLDSKRVPLAKSGSMGFGLSLPTTNTATRDELGSLMNSKIKLLQGGYVQILEVAIASGITTASYLIEFMDRGVRPRHVEIIAPVACQQGVELVLSVAKEIGFSVSILIGQMYYGLGDFWKGSEDSLLNDEGQYVIGKATKILSRFLNIQVFADDFTKYNIK